MLADDLEAHVLEDRQHLGEEDRLAAEELQAQPRQRLLGPAIHRERELLRPLERVHALDVGDRGARVEVVAVAGRESLGVALHQRRAALLAEPLVEHALELVAPVAHRLRDAALDGLGVDRRQQPSAHLHHEVDAREDRLRERERELDLGAVELLEQDALDLLAGLRVVAIARHEDQRGEEAVIAVRPQEQTDPLAVLEPQDAERGREQLVLGGLEQLVARHASRGSAPASCRREAAVSRPSARARARPCGGRSGSPTGPSCRRAACRARGSGAPRPPGRRRRSA